MSYAKYRNKKTSIGGITFDSAKEARRWQELLLLQRAGQITDLTRQKRHRLIVEGKLICTYISDASYIENGVEVDEDTKSPVTRKLPVYRLKAKLFEALMGRAIREV